MMKLLGKDKKYIWHPFTQEKLAPDPLIIERGQGSYLWTKSGQKILDGISSWWVNLHGHCHPHIVEGVSAQMGKLEQVIFAGYTHEPAILLGERVLSLLPSGFSKVFYSDNGSTAVEVGLKMALQFWHNQGQGRKKIVAFRHSYHGDTFGAMSVSHRSAFTQAFDDKLFDVLFIDPPLRGADDLSDSSRQLASLCAEHKDIAAFIYEPMVQGAGGMLMQSPEGLEQCLRVAREHGLVRIADEVMTGFGRTGKLFASSHTQEIPEIVCIAKGLTGGTLPLSATICQEKIYDVFHSDDRMKAFYHGHSFTANPVACAAAHASLDLLEKPECLSRIESIVNAHKVFADELIAEGWNEYLDDIRQQGTILALELKTPESSGYFNSLRDRIVKVFTDEQVLLRPLGNVVYILPPYSSIQTDLNLAYQAIRKLLEEIYKHER